MISNFSKLTKDDIEKAIAEKLEKFYGVSREEATKDIFYKATILVLRELMHDNKNETKAITKEQGNKRVYYLCMEFLLGKSLELNLRNLGLYDKFYDALSDFGIEIDELFDEESDPALGNGGLGRLAACFIDSLTSCDYSAVGYTIMYEYGLFKQRIIDGEQIELPDTWLPSGNVWLTCHPEDTCTVKFGGYIKEVWENNKLNIIHDGCEIIEAVPYDMMITSGNSGNINTIRLWQAKSPKNFDMTLFSQGDYIRAVEETTNAEVISKVLYPSDNHNEGKTLRIKQQYFLVCASIHDIIKRHLAKYGTLDNFAEKCAIHINDTHPTLAIPELMRILLDEYSYSWEDAFKVVKSCISYTNHTVMPEALEVWREELIKIKLPRIYMIICEINRRFCEELWNKYPGDWNRISKMSILENGMVKMANLCIVGSNKVNGVSTLHSNILKNNVFPEFAQLEPDKFTSVTNGISHRRWLVCANPSLSDFISFNIGFDFKKDANELEKLLKFADDKTFLSKLGEIKHHNKVIFADYMKRTKGMNFSTEMVYDVQVKRLHEYKRQLLNVLKIIGDYAYIIDNPNANVTPITHIFAAKAASNYYMAKEIIKLIYFLSKDIESNPVCRGKIAVAFCENYNVSLAEKLIPAADISEQLSLAGKEASGTGNMKLMMNGAVTIGTRDGANIEIADAVGDDNVYMFGLTSTEVDALWKSGYKSQDFYSNNYKLKRIIDMMNHGFAGVSFKHIADYLLYSGQIADPFMCIADFESYSITHDKLIADYNNKYEWQKKSLYNIAKSGIFSSDRSVEEYADKIWHLDRINFNV